VANVIEVENLYFEYKDGTRALCGLNLAVEEGVKAALLGPNGAGKSTLLMHLNGIHLARKGKVRVMEQEVTAKNEKWVRTVVGLVFQDPDDQVFSSTVWEDVAFGPTNMGLALSEITDRVEKALKAVRMLDYKDKPPYHLSYGQKKRVAIAGVLAMSPQVIVLDEPAAYLDPQGKMELVEILDELNRKGNTVIVATHDVDLAAEWAEQVVVIKNGRTLAQGGASLLAEESVIVEAGLCFPVVARIFQQLPELDLTHTPLTVAEAVAVIRERIK
jgi:cobalt/nickel transport system ATP-binding protein